jgi:hypothetical protein
MKTYRPVPKRDDKMDWKTNASVSALMSLWYLSCEGNLITAGLIFLTALTLFSIANRHYNKKRWAVDN